MAKWGIPPIEKIPEALSAIADNRITMLDGYAKVMSSNFKKEYIVGWDNNTYSSNDNASYWQGYIGYPIIAVLILQNKLNIDKSIIEYFKGIQWKELNTKYKNNFSEALKFVMKQFESNGIDCNKINQELLNLYEQLKIIDIERKRGEKRPPR